MEIETHHSRWVKPARTRRVATGICRTADSHGPAVDGKLCSSCADKSRARAQNRNTEREFYRKALPTQELQGWLDEIEPRLESGEIMMIADQNLVAINGRPYSLQMFVKAILAERARGESVKQTGGSRANG